MALLQLSEAAGGAVRQHLPAVREINLNAETGAHIRSITLARTRVSSPPVSAHPCEDLVPVLPGMEMPPKTNTRLRNPESDINYPEFQRNIKKNKKKQKTNAFAESFPAAVA